MSRIVDPHFSKHWPGIEGLTAGGFHAIIKTSEASFLGGFVLRPDLEEGRQWVIWDVEGRSLHKRDYDLIEVLE